MAYLKGGSVVDGNLYVEGGLVVRNIATSAGGQLPTLDVDDANSDRLVKFKNNNGALVYSSLKENLTGDTLSTVSSTFNFKVNDNTDALTIKRNNSNSIEVSLNTSSNYITVKDSTIYNEKGTEIKDSFISGITENTEIPESFKY